VSLDCPFVIAPSVFSNFNFPMTVYQNVLYFKPYKFIVSVGF
jgi:hypothetical protein